MSFTIDPFYFESLKEQPRNVLCRNASCTVAPDGHSLTLPFWGDVFHVDPQAGRVLRHRRESREVIDETRSLLGLFVVFYLLNATDIPPSGEWISEKDIPGGATFFRGPHKIPTELIEKRFSGNLDGFRRRCEALGGRTLDMADAAYRFILTPRLPLAVQFWDGDADFPPEAKLLFDRTISRHLAPDIVFCLSVAVCERLGKPGRDAT
jgi:hypothetical protein